MYSKPSFKRGPRYNKLVATLCAGILIAGTVKHYLAEVDPDAPNKNNTVSIAAALEFTTQDPSQHGYIFTRMGVLETLLNVNEFGELTPGLAKEWQVSKDGLIWTFTLRPNVTFHDGSVLTAKEAVIALNHIASNHGPIANAPIAVINQINSTQFEIVLERMFRPLGAILANYTTGIASPSSYDDDGAVTTLAATGPYQVYEFEPPHKLVVERFEQYWGIPAEIRYASYLTGHRSESRVLQSKSGQADIVFGLEPSSIPLLDNAENVTLHTDAIPRTISIKLNAGHKYLKDVRVRRALHLAIDRNGIATSIFRAPGSEAEQIIPASMKDWHLDDIKLSTDPMAQAVALMNEAGWIKNDQGVLNKDGETLDLTLLTYADRPELTIVATAIQAQWAELGVALTIDIGNSSGIPMGHQNGTLEVALMARNYGFVADPLAILMADFGRKQDGSQGGDWGAMNWSDSTLSQNLIALQGETDSSRYRRIAQYSARIIRDAYPVLPVVSYTQQSAVNKRIEGFKFDPFERSYYLHQLKFAQQ